MQKYRCQGPTPKQDDIGQNKHSMGTVNISDFTEHVSEVYADIESLLRLLEKLKAVHANPGISSDQMKKVTSMNRANQA